MVLHLEASAVLYVSLCKKFISVYLGFLCFVRLQEPLKLDIVISFPDHGFHLRFDPWSQVFLFSLFDADNGFIIVYMLFFGGKRWDDSSKRSLCLLHL